MLVQKSIKGPHTIPCAKKLLPFLNQSHMAEAVVSFTTQRLGDLLISEAKFLAGVSSQLADVQDQLKQMQSFLKDADAKRATNEGVRSWVAQIRDLAYRAEDVLETYAIEVSSKRGNKQIKDILKRFSCIFCECMTLYKIGTEIRDINGKITSLAKTRQAFGIEALLHEGVSSNMEEPLRTSYPHLIEKDFVGMEDEVKKLVSDLRNKEKGCEVVSIWGMGGQGKTTLAKKIYNHVEVQSCFQGFAWVCVTQRFQRKKVLREILKKLLSTETEKQEVKGMEDSELVQRLHKVQKERNCLVVLDDIWTLNAWQSLEPAFPIGETTGSKILLTTRIGQVANIGTRYALRSLSKEEAWNLFLKKAFLRRDGDDAPENRINSKLEEIGRDMVEKCDGLPLAIATLGGLVKGKTELRQWEILNKDIASNLNRGEGINDDEYGAVRMVLALSYDNLPYRLKHCFLYLGNFEEGEEIDAEHLYTLWMAEGMVSSHDRAKGEMMMEVAERYLGDLEQRSLVQLELKIEGSSWSKFYSCYVHDLVRDMCLKKGNEEDFLKVIDYEDMYDPALIQGSNSSVDHMNQVRRLAIYLHDDVDSLGPLNQHVIQQLRSILFSNDYNLWPKEVPNLREFKLLRVLKLDFFKFRGNKLPGGIGKLLHLRFLSLFDCTLNELPSSIGNLRYLETLDLRVADSLTIPNVLWKMKRLKHLYLPLCSRETGADKLRFDGLSELELLDRFDASVCRDDLTKLTNLRVLKRCKVNSLQELRRIINFIGTDFIHSLYSSLSIQLSQFGPNGALFRLTEVLECQHLTSLSITGFVGILPKGFDHHSFSGSLTRINLRECKFEEDPMAVFEKLPNLRTLRFRKISLVGKELVCSANGFPQLRHLKFDRIPNLEKWVVDEGAMPFLTEMEILDCEKLEMLPDGLKFLANLRKLRIVHMPESFNATVRLEGGVEGENFHKVRHVPFITIQSEDEDEELDSSDFDED